MTVETCDGRGALEAQVVLQIEIRALPGIAVDARLGCGPADKRTERNGGTLALGRLLREQRRR